MEVMKLIMTEYVELWRKSLEERGMRVSRTHTKLMECRFDKAEKVGNLEAVQWSVL